VHVRRGAGGVTGQARDDARRRALLAIGDGHESPLGPVVVEHALDRHERGGRVVEGDRRDAERGRGLRRRGDVRQEDVARRQGRDEALVAQAVDERDVVERRELAPEEWRARGREGDLDVGALGDPGEDAGGAAVGVVAALAAAQGDEHPARAGGRSATEEAVATGDPAGRLGDGAARDGDRVRGDALADEALARGRVGGEVPRGEPADEAAVGVGGGRPGLDLADGDAVLERGGRSAGRGGGAGLDDDGRRADEAERAPERAAGGRGALGRRVLGEDRLEVDPALDRERLEDGVEHARAAAEGDDDGGPVAAPELAHDGREPQRLGRAAEADGDRELGHAGRIRPAAAPGKTASPDRHAPVGARVRRLMRAVAITAPGGPEALTVIERDVRAPGPGEVRLAVRAAAVNPTDIGLRAHGAGGDLEPPWIPGMDAAGVVESVGEGVTRLAPGDAVMAAVTPRRPEGGAQAEQIVVPEASVVAIPDGASMAQAATLPMNGLTALLALDLLALEPGDVLAVTGGAGLLASYVIPLAAERGLRVLADARPEDEALVRGFGADTVLPRGDDFAGALRDVVPEGASGLVDTALLGAAAFPALADEGRMAVVRGWDDTPAPRGIDVRPVWVRTVLERTDWLERLRSGASSGRLVLRVAAEYPPEDAARAHEAMDAGGLRGRGVIVF